MIDHLSTYATDFPSTQTFYAAALGELGHTLQADMVFEQDPDLPGRRACAFGPGGAQCFGSSRFGNLIVRGTLHSRQKTEMLSPLFTTQDCLQAEVILDHRDRDLFTTSITSALS